MAAFDASYSAAYFYYSAAATSAFAFRILAYAVLISLAAYAKLSYVFASILISLIITYSTSTPQS